MRIKILSGQNAASAPAGYETGGGIASCPGIPVRGAASEFEPSQIQDLAELIPSLLDVSVKAGIASKVYLRLEVSDGAEPASDDVVSAINKVLEQFGDDFRVA